MVFNVSGIFRSLSFNILALFLGGDEAVGRFPAGARKYSSPFILRMACPAIVDTDRCNGTSPLQAGPSTEVGSLIAVLRSEKNG